MEKVNIYAKGGRTFELDDSRIEEIIVPALCYKDSHWAHDYLNQVLNAPGWKLSGSHCGITGHYALIDPKGEKRRITPFEYHSAIEFPSWEDWDVERERIEREATTVRLKKEADFGIRAKSVLEEVFNINERGGPGSRKQVRALIAQLF